MSNSFIFSNNNNGDISTVYLLPDFNSKINIELNQKESTYLKEKLNNSQKNININSYNKWHLIRVFDTKKKDWIVKEELRKSAYDLLKVIRENEIPEIQVVNLTNNEDFQIAFIEGLLLSAYKFDKYLSENKNKSELKKIIVINSNPNKKKWTHLHIVIESVNLTRSLINEPVNVLNTQQLAQECINVCNNSEIKISVFDKKKIEQLKMGGLLAVNRGSVDPPAFIVMEWKPKRYTNDNPLVLVGKGIVYDTGGLSLKPTSDSMDYMKCDMSGAAVVLGSMKAAANSKLPLHIVGLIPATDNRPSGNAYAPGDIIKMMNNTTVEMLNADAEGRMILADALTYAEKFNPMLVIDLATLTGSAIAAIGKYASVSFNKNSSNYYKLLEHSANDTSERLVNFPLWDEYDELIKSDIADLKNVGGKYAGAITAAKFLEHFTNYPWIHLDIAGTSFSHKTESYKGLGATGTGVRLLFDFFLQLIKI